MLDGQINERFYIKQVVTITRIIIQEVKNLQCDWLLSVHYNTTMHAVFLSSVSWEWDTNVTKFSVVFEYKLLYNARKKQSEKKQRKKVEKTEWKQKENVQSKTIKIKETFVAVFAEHEFDWTTRENWKKAARKLKKGSEKTQKTMKLQKLN